VNQANYNQPFFKQGQFTLLNTVDKNNVMLALTYKLVHRPQKNCHCNKVKWLTY